MSDPRGEWLFAAYLLMRDSGRLPWEVGVEVPRRQFAEAALMLSHAFQARQLAAVCPLLGREG